MLTLDSVTPVRESDIMPASNNPTTRDVAKRQTSSNGRPATRDKTGPQITIATFGLSEPKLLHDYPTIDWFSKVRHMRTDPTIALLRDLVIGPIVSSEWSVGHTKEAPEGAVELVRDNVMSIRSYIVENTLTGWMDFGWQVFEKVWAIREDGKAVIDKVKPLLQEITRLLVSTHTGEFLGTVQDPLVDQESKVRLIDGKLIFGTAFLGVKDCILTNINVEGTYWLGRAIMGNAVIPFDGWTNVNEVADRYDRKIAGSKFIIHYPLGETKFNGIIQDNFEIAKAIMVGLEKSGAIAVPRKVDRALEELSVGKELKDAWLIELLSDSSSQQSNFIDRLSYFDNLKARALGFPERSILQGQLGTKAEAETHSDAGVAIAEFRHQKLTEQISHQLVNDIMRFNYGKRFIGTVFLKASPISEDIRVFLRQIYLVLLQNNPHAALEKINAMEFREKLGLPVTEKGEGEEFSVQDPAELVETSSHNLPPEKGDNTSDPVKFTRRDSMKKKE